MKCFICGSGLSQKRQINCYSPFGACEDCTKKLSVHLNTSPRRVETIFKEMALLKFKKTK